MKQLLQSPTAEPQDGTGALNPAHGLLDRCGPLLNAREMAAVEEAYVLALAERNPNIAVETVVRIVRRVG